MACPRHDFKPGQKASRFCQRGKQRIVEIAENLKRSKSKLKQMKASGAPEKSIEFATRTFTRWYQANRNAPRMYCQMCHIGCKRGSR